MRVRVLPKYIASFGFVEGLLLFFKTAVYELAKRMKIERVTGYLDKPVSMRLATSDVLVFQEVFLDKAYDLGFLDLEPKTIFDVGANVGFTSVFFANAYPGARIFAVEPERGNFEMLLANTRGYSNIVAVNSALWFREGKLRLVDSGADKWAFRFTDGGGDGVLGGVDALTIDGLLSLAGVDCVDILKLDIEGSEVELFSSDCSGWLSKVRVIVIELHDKFRVGCSEALDEAVRSCGFRRVVRGEHTILFR